jgi:hypothetical protein
MKKEEEIGERCPRCGRYELKAWRDLTVDERLVAERLPEAEGFAVGELARLRFCTHCAHTQLSPNGLA